MLPSARRCCSHRPPRSPRSRAKTWFCAILQTAFTCASIHELDFTKVLIDPAGLLPASRGYFTYTGSLTTPPCSEGVRWIVLRSTATLSRREIATFAAHYPNDARPIQNLNGRKVLGTL